MKKIGITQRVEIIESYDERRDCLDQKWNDLVLEIGAVPHPLPNLSPDKVETYLDNITLDAIILSGGNDLSILGEHTKNPAPERDAFETSLIEIASKFNIPVLGICRGMQFINCHFGGSISPIENHAGVRHALSHHCQETQFSSDVNSYHDWGISPGNLAKGFDILATDAEGNVEAFKSNNHIFMGLMWHPEREAPFHSKDINIIRKHLLR